MDIFPYTLLVFTDIEISLKRRAQIIHAPEAHKGTLVKLL